MAEATTVFYWAAGCPYCLRAHIALHETDVPYKSHILDLRAGDQKEKEIIALNPRGTVPIIVDEGPIVMYMLQRLEESQNLAGSVTRPLVMKLHHGDEPKEEKHFKELIEKLHMELGYWESYLTSSMYVAGNDYTLADIATEPFLLLAEHMGATFTAYPHVKQYVDRVKGRKAVAQVLQLHEEAGMHQQDVFGGLV